MKRDVERGVVVQASTNFARVEDIPPGFTAPFTVGVIREPGDCSLARQQENAAWDAADAAIDADENFYDDAGDDAPDKGDTW